MAPHFPVDGIAHLMTDRARDVLDVLLGPERDMYNPSGARPATRDVCVFMLASFCPFELFKGTKRSIGKCRYANHEEYYKAEFERNGRVGVEEYEWDLIRVLVEVVASVQDTLEAQEVDASLCEKMREKEEEFGEVYRSIEGLGASGAVEEACRAFDECERVREELERIKEAYYVKSGGTGMGRCNVCGMRLVQSDTRSKVNRHLEGRLHRGHVAVRSKLADLLKKFGISSIAEIFPDGFSFKYLRGLAP